MQEYKLHSNRIAGAALQSTLHRS